MTTPQNQPGCDACNKSVLSLLLLRPSPIAKDPRLAPIGSAAVSSADGLTDGLVPARKPTESRYVLRLLRSGYVHVYIPSPPPGMKSWLVYRVTEAANLIAQSNPLFDQMPQPPSCRREGHNLAGMKLLPIPQAHKIGSLWIAYSANLWSDKLKSQNAANPKAMQQVNMTGGGRNSFKPTAGALKTQVLECALGSFKVAAPDPKQGSAAQDQEYPFLSLASHADDLAEMLQRAAACHPKTRGLELAVVLRDPVAVAAELNTLRLRRNELAQAEVKKPENAHPLNSSTALMGLKKVMLDANLLDSYEQVSPLRTRAAFAASHDLPPGTEWQPLTREDRQMLSKRASASVWLAPYKLAYSSPELGRVFYPDNDERAAAWARKGTEETWKLMTSHYDEAARVRWLQQFESRMKAEHYEPLAKFEADWSAAAVDAGTLAYFELHFDPLDPNDPRRQHSPGTAYAQESHAIHTPAPITSGAVLDTYLAMLDKPVTEPSAVVLRALVGNQEPLIGMVQRLLTGDPGKDADQGGGMRDKTYDLLKGLGSETGLFHRYGWMGESLARFSWSQSSAITAAVMNAALSTPAGGELLDSLKARIGKAQSCWGIQQAVDWVVGSALGSANKQAARVPVLVTMSVDAEMALDILQARKGQGLGASKSRIKKYRGTGAKIPLTLLTDTDTLKAARGELDALLKNPSTGAVNMKGAAQATAAASMGKAAIFTEEQFLALYAKHTKLGSNAAEAVKKVLAQAGADARSIAMTMDGRLAIGSVLVQGLGLYYGVRALQKATREQDASGIRDAWYGIADSTAGLTGGLLEMAAVAGTARVAANAGAAAVPKSLGVAALRFVGSVAGATGGVVNGMANWGKMSDATLAGDKWLAHLYRSSAFAFYGTTGTSGAIGVGVLADALVARGIGGAAAEAIALRLGAGGAASLAGISISGWGLLLLGAGFGLQMVAIALTPTPMQRWASRSYFGKDTLLGFETKRDDMYAKGDWKAEFEGLQEALKKGVAPNQPSEPRPKVQEAAKAS